MQNCRHNTNKNIYKKNDKKNDGFTLIEVLVVIGIIAVLAAVVLVAVNPSRQFAQARNSQRTSNVNALLNAIGQNIADNRGQFACAAGTLPSSATPIGSESGEYNLRSCIVPNYLPEIPTDPSDGTLTDTSTYSTGYSVYQDTSTKRITINAPSAELGQVISVTR